MEFLRKITQELCLLLNKSRLIKLKKFRNMVSHLPCVYGELS